MKKHLPLFAAIIATFFCAFSVTHAVTTFIAQQGGTGTTTPSGILYGDNGATSHLNTVTIGAGLTFSGGVLAATNSFGYPFPNDATSTTLTFNGGFVDNAASTTFAGNAELATTTIYQSVIFKPSGNFSTSESIGGPIRFDLSGANTGIHVLSTNTSGGVLFDIDQTGSTNTSQAFRLESAATNQSAFNLQCAAVGLGCLKGSAQGDQGVNGSLISLDATTNSNTGMGIFIKQNGVSASLNIQDFASHSVLIVQASGAVGISNSGPTHALDVGNSFFVSSTTGAFTGTYASTTATSGSALCIGTDCRTSWPSGAGGIGTIATSTGQETAGQLGYYTTTAGYPARLAPISTSTIAFSGPFSGLGFGVLVGGSNTTITWTGLATTSALTTGNLLYASGVAGVANVATTTVSVSGPLSITGGRGALVGGSAATIGWSGLSTTTALVDSNLLYGSGVSGVANVGTTTLSVSGPLSITAARGALVGGAAATIGWSGLATTSVLSTSQLLYATGVSGVAGVATSSVTCSGLMSCSGLVNVGGAVSITTTATSTNYWYANGANIYNANVGYIGIGTSTPAWALQIASSTSPQLTLSDGGINHWSFRNAGGYLFLASSSPTTFATSSLSALTITPGGLVYASAVNNASSTAIVLDWKNTPNQVEYKIGSAAVSLTMINATTADMWGATKRVVICNPPTVSAGALTFVGVEWSSTPTQTTTAALCDVYSFVTTRATSTSAFKIFGTAGTGFK